MNALYFLVIHDDIEAQDPEYTSPNTFHLRQYKNDSSYSGLAFPAFTSEYAAREGWTFDQSGAGAVENQQCTVGPGVDKTEMDHRRDL